MNGHVMRTVIGLIAYLIAAFASPWLGYWWWVAFLVLSPVIATLIAARNYECWPVVHPSYSLFYVLPAVLILYRAIFRHPLEWGQWLAWSLSAAIVVVAVLTLALRRHIDREWAVFGTLAAVFIFAAFALDQVNTNISRQRSHCEYASIVGASPGGYRQGGPRLTVSTSSRARQTFFVGWDNYFDLKDGRAVCVFEFDGALGWKWSTIAECPPETL